MKIKFWGVLVFIVLAITVLALVLVNCSGPEEDDDKNQTDLSNDDDTPAPTEEDDGDDEPPKHEHVWGEWKISLHPGCTTAGEEKRFCDCGYFETRELSATGHSVVIDPAVNATCKTQGLTQGSHCSVCRTVLIAQQPVALQAHSYGGWTVTQEPTSLMQGSRTRSCIVCGTPETEAIAKITAVTLNKKVEYTNYNLGGVELKNVSFCVSKSEDYSGKYKVEVKFQVYQGNKASITVKIGDQTRKITSYYVNSGSGSTKSVTFDNISAGNYTVNIHAQDK